MKKLLFTLLLITGITGSSAGAPKDSAAFYYVVQNPKFYGLAEARAWFEIAGVSDKAVERKINEHLKKLFFEKTGFGLDTQYRGTTQIGKTPKGYTDYAFFNGQTYGFGWVRFKDTDSLLYLTDADGYYGSGISLANMRQSVAKDKIGFLGVSGTDDQHRFQLTFSLQTGELLADTLYLALHRDRKDSLQHLFDKRVEMFYVHPLIAYKECEVTDHQPLPDSVAFSALQVIALLNGQVDSTQFPMSLAYSLTCYNKSGAAHKREELVRVSTRDLLYFLREDYMEQLHAFYR